MSGYRLTVLAALVSAFLLVPSALASASIITVNIAGADGATGTVSGGTGANPPNEIDCSGPPIVPSPCSFDFGFGFGSPTIVLTATPDPGFEFLGWTNFVELANSDFASTCKVDPLANPCEIKNFFQDGALTANFGLAVVPPEVEFDPVVAEDFTLAPGALPDVTFHGSVDPNNQDGLTACRFEYLTEAAYQANAPATRFAGATQVPCDPMPVDQDDPVDVTATAVGLQADTDYRVRLLALKNGTAPVGDEATFHVPAIPPVLAGQGAWSVSDTFATLATTLNPANNQVAACEFQYVTAAQHAADGFSSAASAPCVPDPTEIGSGGAPVEVYAEVHGLSPQTAYRFRILADNGVEVSPGETVAIGPETTFITRPTVVFPARGYELVSAFDTGGLDVVPLQASRDGEHFAYGSTFLDALKGSESGAETFFTATRSPADDGTWTQQYMGRPSPPPGTNDSRQSRTIFSQKDFSHAAFAAQMPFDPNDQNGSTDIYLRHAGASEVTWLSCTPTPPSTSCPLAGNEPQTDGGATRGPSYLSDDGRLVLFLTERALLPSDVSNAQSIYAWRDGELSLVSIAPGSSTGVSGAARLGSGWVEESGSADQDGGDSTGWLRGAISPDGSQVIFTAVENSGTGSEQIYVRLDGESTVEATASAPGVIPPVTAPKDVRYWGVAGGDNSVIFSSTSRLTADSTAVKAVLGGTEGSADLYRYLIPADGDPAKGKLVNLIPQPGGAGIQGVLEISDNGKRMYFFANGVLAPGAKPGDCVHGTGVGNSAPQGKCNLYMAEASGSEDPLEVTLVAAGISSNDLSRTFKGSFLTEELTEADASPDGSMFAFRSSLKLVPGRQTGGLPQIYVYSAERDQLSCASCPADGSTPATRGDLIGFRVTFGFGFSEGNAPREVSVTPGGSVFLQTATPLTTGDVPGGSFDLYEWRDGRLDLITSGNDSEGAIALGASADGKTVFFGSRSAYVAGVPSGQERVYAARIGGGFEPPLPRPPCAGEDCKPVATAQPNYAAPATSTVAGRGNVAERPPASRKRCRQGEVRRKGRCIAKRKRAAKRANRAAAKSRRASR